jgi:hypothetical protein
MTQLVDQALTVLRALPGDAQEHIAQVILVLAQHDEHLAILSADERAAVTLSQQAASRGEFASSQDIAALWARFDA